jgi:hypothetical protein
VGRWITALLLTITVLPPERLVRVPYRSMGNTLAEITITCSNITCGHPAYLKGTSAMITQREGPQNEFIRYQKFQSMQRLAEAGATTCTHRAPLVAGELESLHKRVQRDCDFTMRWAPSRSHSLLRVNTFSLWRRSLRLSLTCSLSLPLYVISYGEIVPDLQGVITQSLPTATLSRASHQSPNRNSTTPQCTKKPKNSSQL